MLTLANLAVFALAGTVLLSHVAAAPAPQVITAAAITAAAITTSQDALVPIITVTETYTTHGGLTTVTITIYAFSKEQDENIAPHTSWAVNDTVACMPTKSFITSHRQPVPQVSVYSPPSSVFNGMTIYTNLPHHHGHGHVHKPAISQSIKAPERPHSDIAHGVNTEAYGFLTGVPTHPLTGQLPHDTEKPRHKMGKSSMDHYHGFPITEGGAEAMPTVSPEGTGSK